MKRILCVVLGVLLFATVLSTAYALTSNERENLYSQALMELETYLESGTDYAGSLYSVIDVFEELNNYEYSKQLLYYASVLQKIEERTFDSKMDFYLERLESNDRFNEYLKDLNGPLYSSAELHAYVNGRKAESKKDTDAAVAAYQQCNGFYDSEDRMEKLVDAAYESVYTEAEALFSKGKLENAYKLFIKCPRYKDSDEYVQYIKSKLGYDPMHTHKYQEATCTTAKKCTICGKTEGKAKGHNYDNGKITQKATCVSTGIIVYKCQNCGNVKTERVKADVNNHNWDSGKVTKKATCGNEGVKTYTCKDCKKTKTEKIAKLTTHSATEVRGKKEATCGAAGYTGDTYCKTCGKLISSGRSVSATGVHKWDNGKVTKQPTSTATGVRTYTCKVCGSTKTETIAATGPNVKKGDYVKFGHYPQNKDGKDSTPIEWIVLDVQGDYGLVISRYGLDSKQFHTDFVRITWEKCSLRSWLNNDFYKSAFTSIERRAIRSTTVYNDKKNSGYTDDNTTTDNIFILSMNELLNYFSSDSARICVPTEYAKSKGVLTSEDYSLNGRLTCRYWERTPYEKYVCYVSRDGTMTWCDSASASNKAVRPAMWVNLNKVN